MPTKICPRHHFWGECQQKSVHGITFEASVNKNPSVASLLGPMPTKIYTVFGTSAHKKCPHQPLSRFLFHFISYLSITYNTDGPIVKTNELFNRRILYQPTSRQSSCRTTSGKFAALIYIHCI